MTKNQLGFLYFFLSCCAFSIMDVGVKWLSHIPLGEVMFARGVGGIIPLLFLVPRGRLKNFSFKIDLSQGTQFQQHVWKKLTSIPFGKTRSYQWLATAVSRPKAVRAAGNANGKNPIPLVVPCHRVIRKSGELGGFTGGTHLKKYLLDLEKRYYAAL